MVPAVDLHWKHIDWFLLQALRDLRPGGFGNGQDAEIRRRELDREQQPQQHEPPQGVLHPPGDFLMEEPPHHQQGQNQGGGRQQDFLHFPPPAFSRIADSSAISASLSPRLSAMALIMSPKLPP